MSTVCVKDGVLIQRCCSQMVTQVQERSEVLCTSTSGGAVNAHGGPAQGVRLPLTCCETTERAKRKRGQKDGWASRMIRANLDPLTCMKKVVTTELRRTRKGLARVKERQRISVFLRETPTKDGWGFTTSDRTIQGETLTTRRLICACIDSVCHWKLGSSG